MYREILVYTSTGDTAHRMSEYASVFAATLKAQLTGLVVEVDFIEYAEIAKAITDAEKGSVNGLLLAQRANVHAAALRVGAMFEKTAGQRSVLGGVHYKRCVSAEIPNVVAEMTRLYDCALVPSNEEVGDF